MTVTQNYEQGLIGGNGSKTLSPEREGKTTKMVEQ